MTIDAVVATAEPPDPRHDAVAQEAHRLTSHFGGEVRYAYPSRGYARWCPHGLRRRRTGRVLGGGPDAELIHLFAAQLSDVPDRIASRGPTIVTLFCPLPSGPLPAPDTGSRVRSWQVASESDAARLQEAGYPGVGVALPAIDLTRFGQVPPASGAPPLRLLVGSAPWNRRQFRTKGIDALLDLARERPEIELVFLWRRILTRALEDRIARRGLIERARVIDRHVDVSRLLGPIHAAVVLAERPGLVKTWPQSLLEGIAAGRAVLGSGHLEAVRWAASAGAGIAVEAGDFSDLGTAYERLRDELEVLTDRARALDLSRFDSRHYLQRHERIYRSVLAAAE